MIKSTFSRNPKKLPALCSSKKPSLASLAQKLQDVDLNGKSEAEYCVEGSELSSVLTVTNYADSEETVFSSSGTYVQTSTVASNDEGQWNNVNQSSPVKPVNGTYVDPTEFKPDGVTATAGSTAAECASVTDAIEVTNPCSIIQDKSGLGALHHVPAHHYCSLELSQLTISRTPRKRFAKPTAFGRTLCATPNRSSQGIHRCHRHARFSYLRQMAGVAEIRRRCYSISNPVIQPFDFSTPSPDDVVRHKQQRFFGTSEKQL